jgi:hypothetical protein
MLAMLARKSGWIIFISSESAGHTEGDDSLASRRPPSYRMLAASQNRPPL